jgi:hypothetical protein
VEKGHYGRRSELAAKKISPYFWAGIGRPNFFQFMSRGAAVPAYIPTREVKWTAFVEQLKVDINVRLNAPRG